MRFPKFPIVFVFRFRPMQQPHFQVHSQFKYLFGCFYLQKTNCPHRGQFILPAQFSPLPYTSIPFSGQGQGPAFFSEQ